MLMSRDWKTIAGVRHTIEGAGTPVLVYVLSLWVLQQYWKCFCNSMCCSSPMDLLLQH